MTPAEIKLAVFGLAYVTALCWAYAITWIRAWNQWHHWSIGAAGLTVAYNVTPYPSLWFVVPCLVLMVDDAWQHWTQMGDPEYRSPVHRLYAVVYDFVYKRFGITLP